MEKTEAHHPAGSSRQDNYVLVHTEHHSHAAGGAGPYRCTKVLILALVVAIVVISVLGIVVGLLVNQGTKPPCQEVRDYKKMNKTFLLKDCNAQGQYDIFTAQTTAFYLIYGEGTCLEHWISLEQIWKKNSPKIIRKKTDHNSVCFVEVKVPQDSRVYLQFNQCRPECNETKLHVYEL